MAPRDQREISSDEDSAPAGDLRRGPWTVEEDLLLVNYIAAHGEGRWNALARCAGLRRTGKSCRLRWLNYLRPDLRRGNITAQEQLLILELHSRWGNRWSKIAQHLPGRTDNEIKNYWRTRVQKHARQLNCDVNSQQFKDLIRYLWMPRLLERIGGSGDGADVDAQAPQARQQLPAAAWPVDDVELSCTTTDASSPSVSTSGTHHQQQLVQHQLVSPPPPPPPAPSAAFGESAPSGNTDGSYSVHSNSTAAMWDTLYCQPPPPQTTAAETACSWSDESLLLPAGLSNDMGMGLPELGDTVWGAGADDLWYTQIMGL